MNKYRISLRYSVRIRRSRRIDPCIITPHVKHYKYSLAYINKQVSELQHNNSVAQIYEKNLRNVGERGNNHTEICEYIVLALSLQ